MKIESITLENFQCYYGLNQFVFENGLNIVLGDNGEGKTKFYEAIFWLFNGDKFNLESLISKKKLKENYNGDKFFVSVAMTVTVDNLEQKLKKSFKVQSRAQGIKTEGFEFVGINDNDIGEREKMDGDKLLDYIFPPQIRRYSMFKGEAELDIFKSGEQALSNLVKSFSNASHYDEFCKYGKYLMNEAEKAVNKDVKLSTKSKRQLQLLESAIDKKRRELSTLDEQLKIKDTNLIKIKADLKEADKYFNNAKHLKTLKERIKRINDSISITQSRIVTNYTTRIFDDKWILMFFEDIQKEFNEKIKHEDLLRRKEEKKFNMEQGAKELSEKILNKITPLPLGVPSASHMEEMLKEKICKVCNRGAEEGSEAYIYMEKRLDEFKESIRPKKENQKEILFKKNYTQKLFSLSDNYTKRLIEIRKIEPNLKDVFEFNERKNQELKELERSLEKEEREIQKIIAKSKGESELVNIYENVKVWSNQELDIEKSKVRLVGEISRLNKDLKELILEKEEIDSKEAKSFLIDTRDILRDIETIFQDTRELKYDEFIDLINTKSNEIFATINVDDFTGKINLIKYSDSRGEQIKIELLTTEGEYENPNQSLETTMHMSILFAISEIASEISSEGSGNYPMIFDAPTSSFGLKKTMDFLNLVHSTDKQRIILTYEFVGRDDKDNQVIEEEFNSVKRSKAFWLRRDDFIKDDLSTINTNVTTL